MAPLALRSNKSNILDHQVGMHDANSMDGTYRLLWKLGVPEVGVCLFCVKCVCVRVCEIQLHFIRHVGLLTVLTS